MWHGDKVGVKVVNVIRKGVYCSIMFVAVHTVDVESRMSLVECLEEAFEGHHRIEFFVSCTKIESSMEADGGGGVCRQGMR